MNHYGHMVRVLHCGISRTLTGALAQMELTSAQGRILGFLARQEEAPCPRDLEEEFHLSHPTVSGLLSRLERKDFIELRPDGKDRRCKRIYMRPKGMECHERMTHVILENERRVVDGFTPEEREQFADFLARAANNLGIDPHLHFDKEEPQE